MGYDEEEYVGENTEEEKKEKEEARKAIELEELQAAEDLKALLSTPGGIRFFRRFFEYGRLFNTSFTGNAESTAFNEGRRSLALKIMDDIINVDQSKMAEIMYKKASI